MTHIILGDGAGLPLRLANRHGLVTGATGTGKTVTLQKLAEGFSAAGVPVFAADIKGDLSGIATAGKGRGYPVAFWDLFGDDGMPMKTSIHEMGPMILSRLLALNATQEGVMNIAFRWLTDPDLPYSGCKMMDLEDLRGSVSNMLDYVDDIRTTHGNVTAASVGAIQRGLLTLEGQGGDNLFGEPALDVRDFMRVDADGRGMINLLSADRLMDSPRLYAAFLLWLMLTLFETLPEAGDLEKPKLVFFFDEAHLLFADAPKPLLETIERVVRLIRSKGVGVYFVTQKPQDIPAPIASQLGNRVMHAMRAYTRDEIRSVHAAAGSLRVNPAIDTADAITNMGTGEALVSFLGDGGVPSMVQRIKVDMPTSQIGPVDRLQRIALIKADPMRAKYGRTFVDRAGAFEAFEHRIATAEAAALQGIEDQTKWRDATDITASTTASSATVSTSLGSAPMNSPAEAEPPRTGSFFGWMAEKISLPILIC